MPQTIKNILFVMADQLRWDYLSCYGHPHLQTPHIDSLAARGVQFNRAFVQSPVCGPSRASFYTGRTVFSHGSTWNRVPLPIGELTLGDYLRPLGVRTAVVGKTHMEADKAGLARLGLTEDAALGVVVSPPAFEPYEHDDGLHPTPILRKRGGQLRYNDYLREMGYDGENPWNDYANSAEGPNGELLSGWDLRHSAKPARVKEAHSETAYMTNRAIDFIDESGDTPWLCHLSYIKPHWPYMAPAPYHAMYGPETFIDVVRDPCERDNTHPVFKAFMGLRVSESFSRDEVRETVLPAYMGMIKQIDDHVGRVIKHLETSGKINETMIVMTSDHGDYLGDHWLGEKELFHDVSVKVPLIIVDPREAADKTRGTTCDALVEAIDLVPTFLEATGAPDASHRLEGRSLTPLLHSDTPKNIPTDWRTEAFSEIDYSFYAVRETLNVAPDSARGYMMRSEHWKYIHFTGFAPQLFDLVNDPQELHDLGSSDDHASIRSMMKAKLFDRLAARKNRVTMTDSEVREASVMDDDSGIVIGRW